MVRRVQRGRFLFGPTSRNSIPNIQPAAGLCLLVVFLLVSTALAAAVGTPDQPGTTAPSEPTVPADAIAEVRPERDGPVHVRWNALDGTELEAISPYPVQMHSEEGRIVAATMLLDTAPRNIDPGLLGLVRIIEHDLMDQAGRVGAILHVPGLGQAATNEDLQSALASLTKDVPLYDAQAFTMGLVTAQVDLDDLHHLAQAEAVRMAWLDDPVELHLAQSVPLIRADDVHSETDANGDSITGQGVTIAVLDTGIDHTHSDLGGCFGSGCKVKDGWDFYNDDADPFDDHGHGTHVAATAAGAQGVAPGADLLAYKVCGANGLCPRSNIISAIDEAVTAGADVISMSLGGPGTTEGSLATAADWAVDQGVVVVSSAGNSGPGFSTIGEPGASLKGITVGATDKTDNIASFSSRGPVQDSSGDFVAVKPDLVAPGVDIVAAVPTGSCSLCSPTGYRALSGTSMAAPHVSGTAALLLQARADWAPQDVKGALLGATVPLAQDPRAEGTGRVDAWDAYNAQVSLLPGNHFLGIHAPGDGPIDRMFTVKNIGTTSRTIGLDLASPDFPASLSHTSVSLGPGAHQDVTLTFSVPDSQDFAWYPALVTTTGSAPEAHLRASLWVVEILHLEFGSQIFVASVYKDNQHFAHVSFTDSATVTAPAGTYHLSILYSGCPSGTSCSRAVILTDPIQHQGETTVTTSIEDAQHSVRLDMKQKDGTAISDNVGGCGRLRTSTNPCTLGNHRIWHLENAGTITILAGGSARPDYHNTASDEWTFGRASRIQADHDVYFFGNATRGIPGPIDWANHPDEYGEFDVRHVLPETFEWGRRQQWCGGTGGTTATSAIRIDHGAAETYYWATNNTITLVYPPNPDIIANPCQKTHVKMYAGSTDSMGNCVDPNGCRRVGESDRFHLDDDGAIVQTERLFGGALVDNRYAITDRMVAIFDGAPAVTAKIQPDSDHVTLRARTGEGFFQPASGGRSYQTFDGDKPLYQRVQLDGETIGSGFGTGIERELIDQELTVPGGVHATAHSSGAHLDGVSCAARYDATYHTSTTTGSLPAIDWTRTHGDGSFGSRFPAGTAVTTRFALDDVPEGEGLDVNATLTSGSTSTHHAGLVPTGDVYTIDHGTPTEGPWRLTIEVTTERNETVTLRQEPAFIIGDNGCGPMSPVAHATATAANAEPGEPVTFNASSSYDPGDAALGFAWILNGSVVSNDMVYTTSFTGGKQCLLLRVTNTHDLTDETTTCVIVSPPPVAVADVDPARANIGDPFTFDGSQSYSEEGEIVAHRWSIGESTLSDEVVYVHSFETSGDHCLLLRVTDDLGSTALDEACVQVNHPPVADAAATPGRVNAGETVTFDGTGSTDVDGDVSAYEWRHQGEVVSTSSVHTQSFSQSGTQECLQLTVSDNEGATDAATACVTINEPPVAVASADPAEVVGNDPVQFDATASHDDSTIASYRWTQGGAFVSDEPVFEHSFEETGTHCLDLLVTDDDGATDTDQACANVLEPPQPVALATASPGTVNRNTAVTFDGTDSDPQDPTEAGLDYQWTRDGQVVSTQPSFLQSFSSTGTHCLELTVTNPWGNSDSDAACVDVVNTYLVTVTPTEDTYLPSQQPRIDVLVRTVTGQNVGGAKVSFTVHYESGDPLVDALLQSAGCATEWSSSGTTISGFLRFNVPSSAARCVGLTTQLELITTDDGRWVATADATKSGNSGHGDASYRVGV